MKYEVAYTQQAVRELRKLDRHTRDLIMSWIEKISSAAQIRADTEKARQPIVAVNGGTA